MERETPFDPAKVEKLFKPEGLSKNGQVTIIGGSELFHGAPLLSLTVALFAKNEALLAASCASFITKTAGDELYGKVRTNFNADDLASKVPEVLGRLQK